MFHVLERTADLVAQEEEGEGKGEEGKGEGRKWKELYVHNSILPQPLCLLHSVLP